MTMTELFSMILACCLSHHHLLLLLWCCAPPVMSCHLGNYQYCADLDRTSESFSTLLSISEEWDGLQDTSAAKLELCNLIYYYATNVYGRNSIKNWMRLNKEKSLIDKITASDLAFALIVFENYHPKWVAEIEAQRRREDVDHDEDALANKNQDDDDLANKNPPKQTKKRKRPSAAAGMTLLYTKDPRKRNHYLACGWKLNGLRRFDKLVRAFHKLKENAVVWESCRQSFQSYIDEKKKDGDESCWVPTFYKENDCEGEISCEEDEGVEFDLGLEDELMGLPPPVVPNVDQ